MLYLDLQIWVTVCLNLKNTGKNSWQKVCKITSGQAASIHVNYQQMAIALEGNAFSQPKWSTKYTLLAPTELLIFNQKSFKYKKKKTE